jgi:hypothetical protein
LTRVKHRPTDRRKIKSRGKKLSVPHEISIDLRKICNFISGDTLQIYIQNIREQKKNEKYYYRTKPADIASSIASFCAKC